MSFKRACIGIVIIVCLIVIGWYRMYSKQGILSDVTIGFMGDVMLGRLVDKVIDVTNYTYPWGNLLPVISKNDLNVINLETTLTTSTEPFPKVFNFKASPEKVQTLIKGHIKVANIANNHILDFSVQGMEETIQVLKQASISYMGAGENSKEASKPVIINIRGLTIGLLGFTDNEPTWAAHDDKPGTNYVEVGNINKVEQQIKSLKKQVDLVIVSIHWGPNMRQRPTKDFINFAHAMVEAGADIIHGHSAHVFQGIEVYKTKLILYDTGDFIDDYAVDKELRNDWSFLFNVTVSINGTIKKLQLIPVVIKNMQVNRATGQEAQAIISKMEYLSAELGTKVTSNAEVIVS